MKFKPNKITVHCSATPPTMDIGTDTIHDWHVNGNGWSDIGYHFVIKRDGTLETGRPLTRSGAHVGGHNKGNIGICMVGGVDSNMKPEDNFTESQFDALRYLLTELQGKYGIIDDEVKNHHDYDKGKDCPSFCIREKRKEWM